MLLARLICSDPSCAEGSEEHAGSLEELAAFACHCGCGLELLSVSESVLLEAPQVRRELVLLAA